MSVHPKIKLLGKQFNANTLFIGVLSILIEAVANQGLKKLDQMNTTLNHMETKQEIQGQVVADNKKRIAELEIHEQQQDDRIGVVEGKVVELERKVK